MKAKRSGTRGGQDTGDRGASKEGPTLPPWKAFVVQFSRETSTGTGVFSGRIEHLNSGRRARFASKDELLENLIRLLDECAFER